MGDNGTAWLPDGASTLAPEIDSLFYFLLWSGLIVLLVAMGFVLYYLIRYRRRRPDEHPAPILANGMLQRVWVVLPIAVLLIVFIWASRLFVKMNVAPADSYEVLVHASISTWEFEYPDGTVFPDELHLPVDRPIRLLMSSDDVPYSFSVPALRVKKNIHPNRRSSVWFEATRTGTFEVFSAAYGGTGQTSDRAAVITHPQDEFDDWLASGGGRLDEMTLPELGAYLYEQQICNACHTLDGIRLVGPSFLGLYGAERRLTDGTVVTADDDYLRESILNPGGGVVESYPDGMPPSYGTLDERQISALIAFISEQQ